MIIIETPVFTQQVEKCLSSEEYRELQEYLSLFPEAGKMIQGSGGLRKVRWKQQMKGKRGGVRVIYYWKTFKDQILMLYIFPKNKKTNLKPAQLKVLKKIIDKEYL